MADSNDPGVVYLTTNAAAGNAVDVFARAADGSLTLRGAVSTGGLGTDSGLGSQGSLILTRNRLFAVNAGSNDISVFAVQPNGGLALRAKTPAGGSTPISLTVRGDLLYVLDAGSPANIFGFTIAGNGRLTPIAGSKQPLSSSAPGPAQVSFNNNGRFLVVTEKGTSLIDTYAVDNKGVAHAPLITPSNGKTPFGFAFDSRDHMLVSEAFGGPGNTSSALSSYGLNADGSLQVISGSVPNLEMAACWVVITNNEKFAYTSDTGNGFISSYRLSRDGALSLINGAAADTGGTTSAPIDMSLSEGSRFLYVLTAGTGEVDIFAVQRDGSLSPITGPTG
ncbi:MAG: lactonase family protein, partial [Steroidobacteraceae bacterium]